jgi:hypothetical protein
MRRRHAVQHPGRSGRLPLENPADSVSVGPASSDSHEIRGSERLLQFGPVHFAARREVAACSAGRIRSRSQLVMFRSKSSRAIVSSPGFGPDAQRIALLLLFLLALGWG